MTLKSNYLRSWVCCYFLLLSYISSPSPNTNKQTHKLNSSIFVPGGGGAYILNRIVLWIIICENQLVGGFSVRHIEINKRHRRKPFSSLGNGAVGEMADVLTLLSFWLIILTDTSTLLSQMRWQVLYMQHRGTNPPPAFPFSIYPSHSLSLWGSDRQLSIADKMSTCAY